ncbi:MAG: phosphate propanoyltransferase [Clostridiales bacterium]|nr:phosphate propanoyltransferase [Clostridiales bacterium]
MGIKKAKAPVGCSNRHAHLTKVDVEKLFGAGYELTFLRCIRQPDEFVSCETVDLKGPSGTKRGVRVLGPVRETAQIEVSVTDARRLGVKPAVRLSGNVSGTDGITLVGPCGEVELEAGTIIPARHLHVSPSEAEKLGLAEGQQVSATTVGERSIVFNNIIVRIDPLFTLELHLDTDEFNAAGLAVGDSAELSWVGL